MLLVTPADMQEAIDKIQPQRVAVAYLGAGWRDYLPIESLDEIIVSPTLGTNPRALADLLKHAERHGRPRVYLLESLHAKLYLGAKACLIGSPNLTDNGLGGGLFEASIVVKDETTLQQAHRYLDTLRDKAVSDPDVQRAMLDTLQERWNRAHWHDTQPNEMGEKSGREAPITLAEYTPGPERIRIVWYLPEARFKYAEEKMRAAVPEMGIQSPQDYFKDSANFAYDDDIQPGDWLLSWPCNQDGMPSKNGSVVWRQVHHVISNGAEAEEAPYTKVAATKADYGPVNEPFALDEMTQRLIRKLLTNRDFRRLRDHGEDDAWRAKGTEQEVKRFIDELLTAYETELV